MRKDLNARMNPGSARVRENKDEREDQGKQRWAHQEKQGRKPKPGNSEMKKEQWQICAKEKNRKGSR